MTKLYEIADYLPSVRMCNTCGGKIRAKLERWAALLWASACAESCISTAASLSLFPDHWTCSRDTMVWKITCKLSNTEIDWLCCFSTSYLCTKTYLLSPLQWQDIKASPEQLPNAIYPCIPWLISICSEGLLNLSIRTQRPWYLQAEQPTPPVDLMQVSFCDSN